MRHRLNSAEQTKKIERICDTIHHIEKKIHKDIKRCRDTLFVRLEYILNAHDDDSDKEHIVHRRRQMITKYEKLKDEHMELTIEKQTILNKVLILKQESRQSVLDKVIFEQTIVLEELKKVESSMQSQLDRISKLYSESERVVQRESGK